MVWEHRESHCKQDGMTLVEQIMVLAIIAALTGMAIPSLRRLLSHSELQVAQTDFVAALQHARGVAVTTGKRTLFCPTRDGNNCSNDMRWDSGWLLGHDTDHNNQPDNGALYTGPGYQGKLVIHSSDNRHYVRFQPDGSAGGSNLTLVFCHPSSTEQVLSVFVSIAGRIRGAPANAQQAATCAQQPALR